jgi:hypothetical protein
MISLLASYVSILSVPAIASTTKPPDVPVQLAVISRLVPAKVAITAPTVIG